MLLHNNAIRRWLNWKRKVHQMEEGSLAKLNKLFKKNKRVMSHNGTQSSAIMLSLVALVVCIIVPNKSMAVPLGRTLATRIPPPITTGARIRFAEMSTDQVVEYMGFKSEIHDVFSDGYVIRLTRIINPLANQREVKRTVLFLHGIFQDTVSEFLSFAQFARPEKPAKDSYSPKVFSNVSFDPTYGGYHFRPLQPNRVSSKTIRDNLSLMCLPCLFSNSNYDVWLMDERGASTGSLQVTEPSLRKADNYWSYSLNDSALKDLPKVVNYVLATSRRKSIAYVGLSKGNLVMSMMLAQYPEFSKKLDVFVSLAPIAFGGNCRGFGKGASVFGNLYENLNEPSPTPNLAFITDTLLERYCPIFESICRKGADSFSGSDPNKENIYTDVFWGHGFKAQSMKSLGHISYIIRGMLSPTFDVDYNLDGGARARRRESLPPKYNLSRIAMDKIILVRSEGNDFLSTKEGQIKIINGLKVPIFKDIVLPESYSHLGVVINKNAFKDIFRPVIQAVNEVYLLT